MWEKSIKLETTPLQHGHNLRQPIVNAEEDENNSIKSGAMAMPHENNAIQPETTPMQHFHNIKQPRTNAEEHETVSLLLSPFLCCYAPTVLMVYISQFCPKCDCTFCYALALIHMGFFGATIYGGCFSSPSPYRKVPT